MNRRTFVTGTLSAIPLIALGKGKKSPKGKNSLKNFFTTASNTKLFIKGISNPSKILQLSDTHISLNSEGDQKYSQYGNRMSNGYAKVQHHKTKKEVNPFDSFKESVQWAAEQKVDMIMLTGDILNYPSVDDVSAILEVLKQSGVPFKYIAGNHDWHYEGMDGTSDSLRKTWCATSLAPLYQGENPLCSNVVIGGVNCVLIDNSTHQVYPDQLQYLKKQLAGTMPVALFMHIPVYSPGLPMCCGHPDWNAANDEYYTYERRAPWPVEGNSQTTLDFVDVIHQADNLLGVFVGHEHAFMQTCYKNMNQFLALPSYNGQYRLIEFVPEG